jgi:transcriptional regulator with XRE-family HTH domain
MLFNLFSAGFRRLALGFAAEFQSFMHFNLDIHRAYASNLVRSESLPHVRFRLALRSSPLWHSHNPMATTLAPVDSREVVRCDHCLLVQFRTVNNNCRRCHSSLDEEPEPEPVVLTPPVMMPMPGTGRGHLNLATSIRSLRLRSGLSQRQLAGRMSVPRTYVSKIENEKATPTLSSLERLARALEVTVPELLSGGEKSRQDEISELVKDQFIAEILPFVSQLNGMQMSSVLTQLRDLTIRPRRTA